MAAISSAADGTWIAGAATTWVGGVAPTEGDTVTILNGHDVEIDGDITVGADSATAAIQVNSGGSLFVPSTVAGNYTLTLKGDLKTDATGGTISFGTAANPIPNTRTFTVKTNYSASLADGKYGILIATGGTFNCQGADRWGNGLTDPDRTLLAANAAANATALTVADSTLWLADDRIYIAPTSRTATEYDPDSTNIGQVNSVVGTTLNVKSFGGTGGGVKYAHSGTSPNQAEIINLTRNVVIQNYDGAPGAPGNSGYFFADTSAALDVDWAEFRYLGANAANKAGITLSVTTGSANFNRCSIHDMDYFGFSLSATCTATITNSVFARNYRESIAGSGTGVAAATITNNWLIVPETWSSSGYGISFAQDLTGFTLTNTRISGSAGSGLSLTNSFGPCTIDGVVAHSNNSWGITIAGGSVKDLTFTNLDVRRNNGGGIQSGSANPNITITDSDFAGNNVYNIYILANSVLLDNLNLDGDSTYATAYGIYLCNQTDWLIVDCSLGVNVDHSSGDFRLGAQTYEYPSCRDIYLYNTVLGSATEIAVTSNRTSNAIIKASKHNGTAGLAGEKVWSILSGTFTTDTSYYRTASPSIKMTPISASNKLGSLNPMKIPVASGNNPTISVYFRKSAAYNGNQPRLIVKRNDALGITADTVMATSAAAVDVDTPPGTFTQLSGQPGAVSADGVLECYVDCDGTAGYINLDDWSVTGNI